VADFPTVTLESLALPVKGSFAMGPFGSDIKTDNFVEFGVPIIKGQNLGGSRLLEDSFDFLTEEKADELSNSIAKSGDIVFTHRGTLGQVVMIPRKSRYPRYIVSQSQMKVSLDEKLALPEYVTYYFQSSVGQHVLMSYASQTGVPAIGQPLTSLRKMLVILPSIEEQRAIASVLGALDDKIESNRRTIRTLDELYMAECELALSTSSENVSLGKVASLSLGGTPSKENSSFWEGGDIPWINSGRLHEFPVLTPSDFITPDGLSKSATKLIPKGSTVVAITGATLGVVSRLAIDTAINQSIVAVECRGNVVLNGFMLYALRANMAELVSSATGAAQQHVNKANFEELVISIPAAEGDRLLQNIPDLLGKVDALAHENVTLSLLRNTLLPELLSGRLRVKDAESMMENV
jgi:type I restriction enzyme S subunit